MNSKFEPLFQTVEFPCGGTISSRFAVSPMVIDGSSYEGYIQEDDVAFFERRSKTASLLITGAASVGEYGNAFGYGLGNYTDDQLPGMAKLAKAMKADGGKAVMQIFHPGRQASYTFEDKGVAYGPSSQEFEFLNYPVTGLTNEQVYEIIQQFSDATRRVIEAGFDGVEIHGANHYLIQQFFSAFSNKRADEFGSSLQKRINFPLEVVKAVQKTVQEYAKDSFIIGYRLSPEEIHGENIGYDLDETLYLIDQIADLGIDYFHTSQWGPNGYANTAQLGEHAGRVINEVIRQSLTGRAKLIGAGDITSPEKALAALEYVDIVAMASTAVVEPDFSEKIRAGKEDSISLDISGRISDLRLPKNFYRMANTLTRNGSIPESTIELLRNNK